MNTTTNGAMTRAQAEASLAEARCKRDEAIAALEQDGAAENREKAIEAATRADAAHSVATQLVARAEQREREAAERAKREQREADEREYRECLQASRTDIVIDGVRAQIDAVADAVATDVAPHIVAILEAERTARTKHTRAFELKTKLGLSDFDRPHDAFTAYPQLQEAVRHAVRRRLRADGHDKIARQLDEWF